MATVPCAFEKARWTICLSYRVALRLVPAVALSIFASVRVAASEADTTLQTPVLSSTGPLPVQKEWMIGPFEKPAGVNPVLGPNFDPQFYCPIRQQRVRWEARAIIGGAAVVRKGKVCLVYNAEDTSAGYQLRSDTSPGTMRLGLAVSGDGLHFSRRAKPVLWPDNDRLKTIEWPGGLQIPRLVEGPDRTYYLHYSPYDMRTSRIAVATSKDLIHWTKHGNVFERNQSGKYRDLWAKSGAVVCQIKHGRLIAARINGRYWMYWGEGLFLAHSEDLIHWTIVEDPKTQTPLQVMSPRPGHFDYQLVEGGLAVLTSRGIVVIYNSFQPWGHATRNKFAGLGQALFDPSDPARMLDRCDTCFLQADREYEVAGMLPNVISAGMLPNVIFATGLVYFHDKWFLYHNGGDWVMCVAVSPGKKGIDDQGPTHLTR